MKHNPADTRLIKRMRGGVPVDPLIRHTVEVYHRGIAVFEGAAKEADAVFELLRYGSPFTTEVFNSGEGI